MGIFSRRNKQSIKREDTEPQRPQHLTYSQLGKQFNLNNWVTDPESIATFFGCVELISNSVAQVPIYVKDIDTLEIIKNHPLNAALKYGKMTKFNFIKQLTHDVYVAGNGIAYIRRDGSGDVKELIYCPPGTYTILFDDLTRTVYYQINFITGSRLLDSSNVIHIFKNSKNGAVGLGIGKYATVTLPLSSAADKSALQFFDSGGNVNGILQGKRVLDTEEKMEAYNEWTNAFRGGNKNGNIAVLGNDFEYKQVGISQKDSQSLESREFQVLEICRFFSVNPVLLGIRTGATYSNIEQAQMDLVIHTLLPLIELIEEEFNRKLIRPSQRDKYIVDFDETALLFTTKMDNANYLTTLTKNGLISINDARMVLGYAPKPGCDDLIIPFTNIDSNKVNSDGKEDGEKKEPEEVKEEVKEDGKEGKEE